MSNTLDAFKAQRDAAEAVRAKLAEVAALVSTLQPQIEALRVDQALRDTFEKETRWLMQVKELVREVRAFRESEFRRFRLGVVWRWALACLFALAAIGVRDAVTGWTQNQYAEQLDQLRSQAALAEVVQRRLSTMTPAERQQFDRLMKMEVRRGR
jgi:hypothetical protein